MKIRILISLILLSCTAAGICSTPDETEYYALLMSGKKIGYTVRIRQVADGRVTTTEKVKMTIARADFSMTIMTLEASVETLDGKPIGFESIQQLSGTTQTVKGTFDNKGKVNITTSAMGMTRQNTVDAPPGAIMSEGIRLLQLKKGLKQGTIYKATIFSPSLQAAVSAVVSVGSTENVDLFGRVIPLTRMDVTMQTPAGTISTTSYVDNQMRALKTKMPAMGMDLEMIACDEAFALSENDVVDFLSGMLLKSPMPIKQIVPKSSATYFLRPTRDIKLNIPSTDSQTVTPPAGGMMVVTVTPARATGGEFPYKGTDAKLLQALKPTTYVQSDNKEIIALAAKATAGAKTAAEAAKRIEAFVDDYIVEKNLSVGYASAVEVAQSKQGDCSEHAVLTAAMCRAIGIPARVVSGFVGVDDFLGKSNVFGAHAWTESYVNGKWIGLDATRSKSPFGPTYITLAVGNGDPKDFFAMATTLGNFKIEKITFKD
ncbi:MAG TPA: transglutaminase domain-containing protein [Phycisphaerales bacterium]|nr:transglutaminase domain-containing protein [Phycisphaerales bacterium]